MYKKVIASTAVLCSLMAATTVHANGLARIESQRPPAQMVLLEDFEPRPAIDPADLEALAIAIYQEAGGDAVCDECRYRVADVIMNRVADSRFPDTIEDVLLQEGQYGRLHWTGIRWADRAKHDCEREAVARAYRVAEDVLTDARHSDLYGNGYIWQAGFTQGTENVFCCGHYYGR